MAKTSLWHLYLARNCPQHLPNNSITTAGHKAGLKGAQHPAVYYLHALHLTSLSRCRSLCKRWELFFVKPGVDSINGIPYYLNKCQKLLNISQMTFFFQEDSTLVHMHCACNTVQLLRLSRLDFLSLKPCPQQPKLNALTTRFRESYSSVSMSHESKRLKKSRNDWLNSGNALIHHFSEKMRFLCFPFCQVVQKHTLLEVE